MLTPTLTRICAWCGACLLSAVVVTGAGVPALAAAGGRALPASSSGVAVGHHANVPLIRELVKAWRITKGQGVTVAVIGGRVDPGTPGLSGKVRTGRAFGNFAHAQRFDSTLFASAVAANGPSQNNPYGSIGLAPAARILSVRVPLKGPYGTWQDNSAHAIRYAVNQGAKVIYFDESGYSDTPSLDQAVAYATSRDAVIVCGAFALRKNSKAPQYPDNLPGVIAATSLTVRGLPPPQHHERLLRNDSVLIAGPGNLVQVTGPQGVIYFIYNDYAATAWVVATVALVKSMYPHLSAALTEQALVLSATHRPRGGYSVRAGYGLVNPLGALQEAAKLRKLQQVARTGSWAVNPSGRLAAGPVPGAIEAVRHPLAKVAGFGTAIVLGVILLCLAAVTARRSRRRRALARAGHGLSRALRQDSPPGQAPPFMSPPAGSPFGASRVAPPFGAPGGTSPSGVHGEAAPFGAPEETSPFGAPASPVWAGETPPGPPAQSSWFETPAEPPPASPPAAPYRRLP